MEHIQEVRVGIRSLDRFVPFLGEARVALALEAARHARDRLSRRVVWNLNSTSVGGGVAEMLPPLLGYTRALGIDSRWVVIGGDPDFFRVTKRLHHALHGSKGDGSPLDERAQAVYQETLRKNARELESLVRADDVVLLHDPQTAGLAPYLLRLGARVIWRCHIGLDHPNAEAERGWAFLRPYILDIPAYVFSRETYVPPMCDHGKSVVITPSIDAFSAKNQELEDPVVHTILVHTGLLEGPPPEHADHGFLRDDGSPGRVERHADVVSSGRLPSWDTPLVVQVSRWDPLKDMAGVMEGFVRLMDRPCPVAPHLVLAGPDTRGVTDDPEGAEVYEDALRRWHQLPASARERIHLASLPTDDVEENAAIVNALQRHATVVVQKSLQEGFGLTVTEAMWKGRPVVASAVGGIQDQIEDGVSGILLRDPSNLDAFAEALFDLLSHPDRMQALAEAGRASVRDHFLNLDHLLKYAVLLERLDAM